MRRNERVSKGRIEYIFSYIAACALPLIACAALILSSSYASNREQADEHANSSLALTKTQLDLKLKYLEAASMHFASNTSLLEEESKAHAAAISAQLARYKASYPFISEAVYLPVGRSYIYDTDGVKEYNSFRDSISDQVNLDISSFFTSMNQLTSAQIRPMYRQSCLQIDGEYIVYMHPIPYLETDMYGAIAFFVSKESISDIFMDCMGDMSGYYYVLDHNMAAVYTSDNGSISQQLCTQMNRVRGTGLFEGRAGDTDYVMLRAISDVLGAYYMLAIPSEAFYGYAHDSFSAQGGFFALAILSVLIIAAFLARVFYSPIEQLARRVNPKRDEQPHSHVDMLRDVGIRYQQMSDEYEILNLQVDQQRDILLRQLVIGLLQGQISEAALSAILQSLHLKWKGGCFFAMHVWLDTSGGTGPKVLEWALPSGAAYLTALEDDRQYAVLADVRAEGDAGDAARQAVGQACADSFRSRGLTPVLVGVGSVVSEVMSLSFSYIEALSVGSQLKSEDHEPVILFTPSSYEDLSAAFLPVAEKQLICQCIESGNPELARQTIDRLFEGLIPFSANRMLIRSIAFYLYDAVATTVSGLHLMIEKGKLDFQMASIVPARFMLALEEYVLEACELVRRRSAHSVQKIQSEILQYVHAHYTDYDIAIDSICEQFELSESYLSRFFKQETGYTFAQYVTMLRMNRVKHLLETTYTPIKGIVQSVGYADAASFTRKFRNQEGMTPGEYRLQAQRQVDSSSN